jgi:hypothetical protein
MRDGLKIGAAVAMAWHHFSSEARASSAQARGRDDGASFVAIPAKAPGAFASDRERLKPSFLDMAVRYPLTTVCLVVLYGVLVFGGVLP